MGEAWIGEDPAGGTGACWGVDLLWSLCLWQNDLQVINAVLTEEWKHWVVRLRTTVHVEPAVIRHHLGFADSSMSFSKCSV